MIGTYITGLLNPLQIHLLQWRRRKDRCRARPVRLQRILHQPILDRLKRQMLGGKVLLGVESGRRLLELSNLPTDQFPNDGGIVRFFHYSVSMYGKGVRVAFSTTFRLRRNPRVLGWVVCLRFRSLNKLYILASQFIGANPLSDPARLLS